MATKPPKKAGPATKGLQITAKREKFYSGGIAEPFGFEARVIPMSELTEDQVAELTSDPYLVVKEVDVQPEPEAK